MVASRRRPKGGLVSPFGLGFLTFIVVPSAIGSQDLASLIALQPIMADRPMARFSLITTAHGATFTMPRPMSAAMPASLSYTLAGLDTSYAEITGSIRERLLGEALLPPDEFESPVPNRRLKGSRLPDGRRPSGRRRLPGFVKALQALSKHSLLDGLKQAEELDPTRLRQLARQIARTQTELVKVQGALNKQTLN